MPNLEAAKAFLITIVSPATNEISVTQSDAIARNSRMIWAIVAAMAIATIIAYWGTGLSFASDITLTMGKCALPLFAVGIFYRRVRPDPLIGFSAEVMAQLVLAMALGCSLSFPLAVVGFPYRDALLNSADVWMGLDWRAYLRFVNDRPLLSTLTAVAYHSTLFQLLVVTAVLVSTRHFCRLQQFVLANAIGLCIALAIFTFVPAGGTYSFFHIAHGEFGNISPATTADQKVYLDALRSGRHVLIDGMAGLITFPSFHSAWAFFFMWAFYPIRWLRAPAILLNLAVLASTPVQGAHYFIDLIGGGIVAAISVYSAFMLTSAAPRIRAGLSQRASRDDVVNGTEIVTDRV